MSANDETNPIRDVSVQPDQLVVQMDLPNMSPADTFQNWIAPEKLTRWWPEEAHIEAGLGGSYRLSWPTRGWNLRGQYTRFEPSAVLGFTWSWEHNPPEAPTYNVLVEITPHGGGSLLTVTHCPYNNSHESQEAKQGHLEGWTHFLTRLHDLSAPA